MVYDLLLSIGIAISSYIFYKIFANSIIVISEFGRKKVYAIEEVIGASILLAVASSSFRDLSIFGFEIRAILSILIVLILGWKNGVLVGATTGVTIGTILGLTNTEMRKYSNSSICTFTECLQEYFQSLVKLE